MLCKSDKVHNFEAMANKIENRHCVENEQFASHKDPYNTNLA